MPPCSIMRITLLSTTVHFQSGISSLPSELKDCLSVLIICVWIDWSRNIANINRINMIFRFVVSISKDGAMPPVMDDTIGTTSRVPVRAGGFWDYIHLFGNCILIILGNCFQHSIERIFLNQNIKNLSRSWARTGVRHIIVT